MKLSSQQNSKLGQTAVGVLDMTVDTDEEIKKIPKALEVKKEKEPIPADKLKKSHSLSGLLITVLL